MRPEHLLNSLSGQLEPSNEEKKRLKNRVLRNIETPLAHKALRGSASVNMSSKNRIWSRISNSISPSSVGVLEGVRTIMSPSLAAASIKMAVLSRIEPQTRSLRTIGLQWVAAFAAFAVLIASSPSIFLAPPTQAEFTISLIPTKGQVAFAQGGLWHPVTIRRQVDLKPGMLLRTQEDGRATIILPNGVVRLDSNTTIEVGDLSVLDDKQSPHTFLLFTGRMWVQGLSVLNDITIETDHGHVVVHEGSVSISEESMVDIEVLDGRSTVVLGDEDIVLSIGERVSLRENGHSLVKKVADDTFERDWYSENLKRDAVHRQEIAHLQHERRIARAGILPTSRLYPVKRLAERVDVLLTFSEQGRVSKELQHADTRLSEAAALLSEGLDETAQTALQEYRDRLLSLSGEEEDPLIDFLLREAVTVVSTDIAAARPGDDAYALKKVVLETSADMNDPVLASDIRGTLFLDALSVLDETAEDGNSTELSAIWRDIQPTLAELGDPDMALSRGLRKEADHLLGRFAVVVHTDDRFRTEMDPEVLEDIAAYLPAPAQPLNVILSEEEIQQIVQGIRDRIFVYHIKQSRINQMIAEFKALQGHPDRGRILRRLFTALPHGPENFPDRVRRELVKLRWERAAEVL